jgi:hypothetical protein
LSKHIVLTMFQLPVQNGVWVVVGVTIVVALSTVAVVDGSISVSIVVVFILSNGILQ